MLSGFQRCLFLSCPFLMFSSWGKLASKKQQPACKRELLLIYLSHQQFALLLAFFYFYVLCMMLWVRWFSSVRRRQGTMILFQVNRNIPQLTRKIRPCFYYYFTCTFPLRNPLEVVQYLNLVIKLPSTFLRKTCVHKTARQPQSIPTQQTETSIMFRAKNLQQSKQGRIVNNPSFSGSDSDIQQSQLAYASPRQNYFHT